MAIVKVGTYRNPPEDITDYEAIVSHLEAYTRQVGNQGMILTEWTNITNAPKIAMGSYISHGGVLYVVEGEDYSLPSLSSDGTYYIRVVVSGDTLALDYITDLTGYVWNAIYNGLYHPDGKQVLPYQVVKSGALVEKWKITNLMQGGGFSMVRYDGVLESLVVTGAISGATVNGASSEKEYALRSDFAYVSGSPMALTFNGTNLISANNAGTVYTHNGISASTISSFSYTGGTATGLAFNGTNLISCNNSDTIQIHSGISATILSSFASPSTNPTGLAFDGTNLISCDADSNMIYVHDGISATILSSFASPSTSPTGLAFDGENLISCDGSTGLVYIHDGISATILSSFIRAESATRGLAFGSKKLIVGDAVTNRLYVYNRYLVWLI